MPPSQLFKQLSSVIQPMTNRLIIDYNKSFVGNLNYPFVELRPHYKGMLNLPWTWTRVQIKVGANDSSSCLEAKTEIPDDMKSLLILVTFVMFLGIIFVVKYSEFLNIWESLLTIIGFIVFVWFAAYSDLAETHSKSSNLFNELKYINISQVPDQMLNSNPNNTKC
jgi:hypothetical protein